MSKNAKLIGTVFLLIFLVFIYLYSTKNDTSTKYTKKVEKIHKLEDEIKYLSKTNKNDVNKSVIIQKKKILDENITDLNNNFVKFERIYNPDMKAIAEIDQLFVDFIDKYNDARYFKPDIKELKKLFNKKVGDEVTLTFDTDEFTGVIVQNDISHYGDVEIDPPQIQFKDDIYYSIRIQPSKEDYSNAIGLFIAYNPKTGRFSVEGDIDYGGIVDRYSFHMTNKVGLLIPYNLFNHYLFNDLGVKM